MKRFFIAACVALAAVTAFLPYVLKAANSILVEDTAADLNAYVGENEDVKLEKGDFVLLGSYLEEPILWRVLEVGSDGRALLMTHYVITFKAFDACGKSEIYHRQDSEKYGSSDWESCTLKLWLNSDEEKVSYSHCPPTEKTVFGGFNSYDSEKGFLCEDNFSQAQKALIQSDSVFILSKDELSSFLSGSERIKTATKSALMSTQSPYFTSASRAVWYWTSSPVNSNAVSVATVTTSGGFYKALAYDGLTGVAPSLYLKSADVSAQGEGTRNNPYLVSGGAEE